MNDFVFTFGKAACDVGSLVVGQIVCTTSTSVSYVGISLFATMLCLFLVFFLNWLHRA